MEARTSPWLGRLLILSVPCCAPLQAEAPVASGWVPVSSTRVAVPPTPTVPPPVDDAPPCSDELGSTLARVSCDGSRVLVAGHVELGPDRPRPAEPSRKLLEAAAGLLRDRPEILLVRIEVGVGHDAGRSAERQRAAWSEAQRRAEALLDYLWRREGISAERLEAAGYPFSAERQDGSRWPVVLRIVQHAN